MPESVGRRKTSKLISHVGTAIRIGRAERRLSQQTVADLAGVGANTVHEMESEKGNPRLATVERVCKVLGLEVVIRGEAA